jgi:hypothetical protein
MMPQHLSDGVADAQAEGCLVHPSAATSTACRVQLVAPQTSQGMRLLFGRICDRECVLLVSTQQGCGSTC